MVRTGGTPLTGTVVAVFIAVAEANVDTGAIRVQSTPVFDLTERWGEEGTSGVVDNSFRLEPPDTAVGLREEEEPHLMWLVHEAQRATSAAR